MNKFESLVKSTLEKSGHIVLRNGWPDFLVYQPAQGEVGGRGSTYTNKVAAFEVKNGKDTLSHSQVEIHKVLKLAGIPVYIVRPEDLEKAVKSKGATIWSTESRKSIESELETLKLRLMTGMKRIEDLEIALDNSRALFER